MGSAQIWHMSCSDSSSCTDVEVGTEVETFAFTPAEGASTGFFSWFLWGWTFCRLGEVLRCDFLCLGTKAEAEDDAGFDDVDVGGAGCSGRGGRAAIPLRPTLDAGAGAAGDEGSASAERVVSNALRRDILAVDCEYKKFGNLFGNACFDWTPDPKLARVNVQ